MKAPISLLPLLACVIVGSSVRAGNWPQWRGPNRDAVVTEASRPLNALPAQPKTLWKIKAGAGQAAPVVAGSRLVFLDSQGGQETAHCVQAATGEQIWSVAVAPAVQFQNNYGDGPRCTPLIDGDHVYVQSCSGEFRCLALADGKTVWRVNFETDYGATFFGSKGGGLEAKETASRRHGNNGSAAIDGERIFVPVGSPEGATLVAYDKKSGKELWRAGQDNTAYASVMVGTLAGVLQVVHFTADALMGVEVANGRILWRVPLKTGAKRHVCTPVLSGDTVTVASTSIGTLKFRVVKAGGVFKAEPVWANLPLKTIIATPVLAGSHLFTLGPGARTDFVCVDFEKGTTLWSQPGFGDYASIMAVNDKLLALNSNGELFLIKANPAKYEELGRLQVCGKTWASPAYVNGTLFVKDDASLSALVLAD